MPTGLHANVLGHSIYIYTSRHKSLQAKLALSPSDGAFLQIGFTTPHCTHTDFRDLCPGSAGAGQHSTRIPLDHVLLHTHCPSTRGRRSIHTMRVGSGWGFKVEV